jgi:hypothetical protein
MKLMNKVAALSTLELLIVVVAVVIIVVFLLFGRL